MIHPLLNYQDNGNNVSISSTQPLMEVYHGEETRER